MVKQVVDDGNEPASELGTGHVEADEARPATGYYDGVRAVLWVPDPEQRHGWRELYVHEPAAKKPGGRIGF
jgi:hypothetical protein